MGPPYQALIYIYKSYCFFEEFSSQLYYRIRSVSNKFIVSLKNSKKYLKFIVELKMYLKTFYPLEYSASFGVNFNFG